jgi:phage gp29-like protein
VAGLLQPQAVDALVEQLTAFRDPDEVLRRAGLSRGSLRAMESDDEISAALETRLSALLRTPWRLEPADGPASEFLLEHLTPVAPRLLAAFWHAVPYGYSVVETVYAKRDDGRLVWAEVEEKPFEWFTPRQTGVLEYSPRSGGAPVEVDTTWKFHLARRNASYRQPYGEALLSRLYWAWQMRSNGWRFWARFLERFGAPLLIGKTAGDTQAMATALAAAVQSAVAAIGAEDDVQPVSPANAGDAFDKFDRAVDKRIQKVILGQTLTSDIDKGGSYAAAKVQDDVRDDRRMADVRLVVPAMQHAIDALSLLNFPAAAPPQFVMEDEGGLQTERAERDAKLTSAGVLQFTEQYLLDRYDLEPGDFVVPQGVTTPQGGARAALFAAQAAPVPRFTRQQQEVEDLADATLDQAGQPIDPKLVRSAVLAASDPEDLAERLAVLLRDHTSPRYQETLERALFAADVLGYIHADGK